MNVYEGKRFIKKTGIVLGCVFGFVALVGGLSYLIEADHQADQKVLCGSDRLEHTFYYDHRVHAICMGNDGVLYLTERTK